MPISRPSASNSGPPELPGLIAASACRQSVYSSSVPAGKLIAMHARNHAEGDRRLEVGGQQERIADGKAPVAGPHLVAVGQFGMWEIVAAEQLDQGDVAGRIDAHDHGVVHSTVGHATLHGLAGFAGDVEIAQRVTIRRDHHGRAAPLAARGHHGHRGTAGTLDDGHAIGFGLEDGRIDGRGG